jgi:putative membrane protein
MKTRVTKPLFVSLIAGLLGTGMFFAGCDQSKDSKEVADEQNKDKFENVNDDRGANADADRSPAKFEQKDAMFMSDAANIDMAEIYVSTEAAKRATNAGVKRFAQMMVDDHKKTSAEAQAMASKYGVSLPTSPNENDVKNWKGMMDEKGYDFNKDYMDWAVQTHKDAIDKFEDVAEGNDYHPELRDWANKTLPALRHHREEAERIRDMVKDTKKDNK